MNKITVQQLMEALNLNLIQGNAESPERIITLSEVSRPGLELSGFFDYSVSNRIQMLGKKELAFIKTLSEELIYQRLTRLFTKDTPMLIVAWNLEIPKSVLQAANDKNVPVFHSPKKTTGLLSAINSYLDDKLAPRESVHGVLMDIYGLGVLIQGESGIGKSETALELIREGHRIVADDRVDVYQHDEITLMGEAPKILERMLEIRGVGIIDCMDLFGASAVRGSMKIDLTVYLQNYEKDSDFDRLGNGIKSVEFAGVKIPQIKIPVRTGRNISIVIETAAMNFRAKTMGFDATQKFNDNLTKLIKEQSQNK